MKKLALFTVIAIASSAALAQGAKNDAPPASPAATEAPHAKAHAKKHEHHKKEHHQANHGTEVKGAATEGKAPAK